MAVFQQQARRAFVERLVEVVATDYPGSYERLGDAGTRDLAERAIAAGKRYGIETEGGVVILLGLMVQYGESLERSPDREWAESVLRHPVLPGAVKIDQLVERLAGRSRGRVVVVQGED
jgi:hypothetical protein